MKKILIMAGIILIIFIGLSAYVFSKDNIMFKFSYEMVNSLELTNGKKIKVKIPFDNRVNILNEKEALEFIKSGTGIVYFGYSTCPWCRNAIPVLIDVIRDNDIKTLYYVDVHSVNTTEISKYLEEYLDEDSEGNKRLAVPDVYAIKDGEVLGHHIGTVESYNNPYKGMNDEQIKELKDIYNELIEVIK